MLKKNIPLFIRNIHPSSHPENGENYIYTANKIKNIASANRNNIGHINFKIIFSTIEETKYQNTLLESYKLLESSQVQCLSYSGDHSKVSIDLFLGEIFSR